VVVFLETAELRAKNKQDITIDFWRENVDKIIELNDKLVLENAGSVSQKAMEEKVREIYDDFDSTRKHREALETDREEERESKSLENLEKIEQKIKNSNK